MGSLGEQTAVEQVGRGALPGDPVGRLGDLGTDGRVRRGRRPPRRRGRHRRTRTRPPSRATTSASPGSSPSTSGSSRARRGERPAPTGSRSPRTASRSSTPWCGARPTARASSTTRRRRPTCRARTSCRSSRSSCPRTLPRRSRSGGTSTPSRSTSSSTGRPTGPGRRVWQEWLRFLPDATFDDPWVDAARSVILVDLPSWPSAHRPHAWQQPPFMAPTLDLNVAFHRPTADELAAVRRRRPGVDRRAVRLDRPSVVARAASCTRPAAGSASTASCARPDRAS